MSNEKKRKDKVQLGTMFKMKNKETGELRRDENGNLRYYVGLAKDKDGKQTELSVNGKPFSGLISVERPRDKFDRMLKLEKITPEEHEQKVSRYEPGGDLDYIQFELNVEFE